MPLSAEEQKKLDEVKGIMTQEVQPLIDKGVAEAKDLIGAIDTQVKELAAWIEEQKAKAGVSLPGVDEGKEKFSFAKAAYAMARKDWKNAGYERDVIEATTAKAQTSGVSADGGALVPNEVAADIIDRLRPMSVLMNAGISEMNFSGIGKYELPRVTGSTSAYWLGELDTITDSQAAFDRVSLTPKKVAALVHMSRELLYDANQSVENFLRNDMAQQLALAIDIKGLRGDGLNDTPLGILNTVGINSVTGANGTQAVWQTFDDLIAALEDADALGGRLKFISNPRVFRALRGQTSLEFSGQVAPGGEPLMMPLVSDAKLRELLGYDFGATTQIPKNKTKGSGSALSELYFGDWSQLILGRWGGLELDASDTAGDNFKNYGYSIRAVTRVDFAVRQPKAFVVAPDIGTARVSA